MMFYEFSFLKNVGVLEENIIFAIDK